MKTTVQIVYDKSLFDSFPKTDKVLTDFLFIRRRRLDIEKLNDDVIE